jgi:hypothetical protein
MRTTKRATLALTATLVVLGALAPSVASGQAALAPPFDSAYSLTDIGAPPGVPPRLGGLTLKAGTTDRLLIGGEANDETGALYEIGVTRDIAGHITGFSGIATRFADAAFNDGGVTYVPEDIPGPDDVLFLARWPNNELGQTRTGSSTTDKVIDLGPLGVASSLASLQFVPPGQPGAGSLKLASWSGGQFYDAAVTDDGTGTYDLANVTEIPASELPGGADGFAYVNEGSAEFSEPSMLVSEFSDNSVAVYEVGADGDPIIATRRTFISGLAGALGAFVDPLTGDFLFSTFETGGGSVVVVRGFAPPPPATLEVVKNVVNDHGGTKVAGDFSLHVKTGGADVAGSPQPGDASGTTYTLDPHATYTVSEDPVAGYADTISGDCAGDGTITLQPGDSKTCTITNDDVAPTVATLRVVKQVVNDDGGSATAGEWTMHIRTGDPAADVPGKSPFPGAASPGTTRVLDPGSYTIGESGGRSGYAATISGACAADGTITLQAGDDKTCTITNDDVAPTLRVIKHVVNDNLGSASAGDWTMHVKSGEPPMDVPMQSPFPGAESPGVSRTLRAGSYVVSESGGPSGYSASITGDCAASGGITLQPGQNKTCTIVNNDPGMCPRPPGVWEDVHGPDPVAGHSQVASARGSDGSLFAAFQDASGDIALSRIRADGCLLSTAVAIPDVDQSTPALLREPSGQLRLLYNGDAGTFTATAPAEGAPWSAGVKAAEASGFVTAGALGLDGTAFFGHGGGDASLHRGLDPASPDHVYQADCCPSSPALAVDGVTGAPYFAWNTGAPTTELTVRQGSAATGEPTGAPLQAPGKSGGVADAITGPLVALSGRTGLGGVYAAYVDRANEGELLLWRVGEAAATVVAVSPNRLGHAALAPAPDGSLWLMWLEAAPAGDRVGARQLRPDGTTLGPITFVDVPAAVSQLTGNAQADRLDVLLASSELRLHHTQVLAQAALLPPPVSDPGPPADPGTPAAPSAPAEPPTRGALSGRVTQTDGVAVPDALVEVCPRPSGLCLFTNTDADGRYRLDGLAPGDYVLTAFPPSSSPLNVTTRPGVSTVAAGAEVSGQDIVMSGPLRRPRNAHMFGPGYHGDVDGVPVIVRNQPLGGYFDIPCDPEDEPFCYPRVTMTEGFDPPEPPRGECAGPAPPPRCSEPPTEEERPVFIREPLEPVDDDEVVEPPPTSDCDLPNPPLPCVVNVVRPPPTPPRTFRWGFYLSVDELQRGRARGWTTCIHYNRRGFSQGLPTVELSSICFNIYIDPSGYVRTTRAVGIPGARVVLLRSDAAAGPFAQVANGSAIMSPANRRNPDVTDATGHFGWDVVSGYYKVTASKSGCTAPRNRRQQTVETQVYEIPPPVTDVDIRLRCPPPPRSTRRPRLSGQLRVGRRLSCSTGRWSARPRRIRPRRFSYVWRRGDSVILDARGRRYRLRRGDRRKRISCLVVASNSWGSQTASSARVRVR